MLDSVVQGCVVPPGGWPTDIENINAAPIVLLGKVVAHHKTGSHGSYYTADMDVYCVLKGPAVAPTVSITGAGFDVNINDCWGVQLNVGETYIVTVSASMRALYPSVPIEGFYVTLKACGLNEPTYPEGIISGSMECPKPLPPGQCSPK